MIQEEALGWVIRTRDPDFIDWTGFTAWLEADSRHAAAYDVLATDDADLAALVPSEPVIVPPPANDVGEPGWRRWRWLAGGAIAAALVATLSIATLNRTDIYTVTTKPGETRVIALEDGTRIDVNGGSTLRLDHKNLRFAALDQGEAAFTVTHDEHDPFRVKVGETVFEDAGTVFNIVHSGTTTRIGVSEGLVVYNPESEAISLPAGRALVEDAAGLRLSAVDRQAVASWRQGRLIYDNAPIGEVTGDISRSLGVRLDGTSSAKAMRFTGTILLDKDAPRFFARTAPLLGLSAVRQGDAWLLKEKDGTQR
ncbi:FecR family protein [Sphingobium aromaticiconvertens]|uniref:FecR family protein n=1 Tax=Sphingobium aromaticiconvertens TaxID=365341 RepID=UPI00301B2038